jgi:hypothetical protein
VKGAKTLDGHVNCDGFSEGWIAYWICQTLIVLNTSCRRSQIRPDSLSALGCLGPDDDEND